MEQRNPSLKSPKEFFYDLLIAKSIIPAEMVDKMQVPWWLPGWRYPEHQKICRVHGERTNHEESP